MTRFRFAAALALALGALGALPHAADTTLHRSTRLTFDRAVALPGITLPPGSYIFEVVAPGAHAVRVMSADQRRHHFLGLTQPEAPRRGTRQVPVIFGEAPAGDPPPIAIWYPDVREPGHRFVYR